MEKKYLKYFIHPIQITNNHIWIESSKNVVGNLEKKLLILCAYKSDLNSKYFDPNAFDNIAEDIANFCDEFTPIVITSDMNGRTGSLDYSFNEP